MAINSDSHRLNIIPVINYYSVSFPNLLGHLRACSTTVSVNRHWDDVVGVGARSFLILVPDSL